jgi:hypothetical protein
MKIGSFLEQLCIGVMRIWEKYEPFFKILQQFMVSLTILLQSKALQARQVVFQNHRYAKQHTRTNGRTIFSLLSDMLKMMHDRYETFYVGARDIFR